MAAEGQEEQAKHASGFLGRFLGRVSCILTSNTHIENMSSAGIHSHFLPSKRSHDSLKIEHQTFHLHQGEPKPKYKRANLGEKNQLFYDEKVLRIGPLS